MALMVPDSAPSKASKGEKRLFKILREAKRELYVSMTRATDVLCLFGSGRFPVLQELEGSNSFDIVKGSSESERYA